MADLTHHEYPPLIGTVDGQLPVEVDSGVVVQHHSRYSGRNTAVNTCGRLKVTRGPRWTTHSEAASCLRGEVDCGLATNAVREQHRQSVDRHAARFSESPAGRGRPQPKPCLGSSPPSFGGPRRPRFRDVPQTVRALVQPELALVRVGRLGLVPVKEIERWVPTTATASRRVWSCHPCSG